MSYHETNGLLVKSEKFCSFRGSIGNCGTFPVKQPAQWALATQF